MEIIIPLESPTILIELITLDAYDIVPGSNIRKAVTDLVWIHREKVLSHLGLLEQLRVGLASYHRQLPRFLEAFKKLLEQHAWDLLLEAPSSKPHAKKFADVAREIRNETPCISFTKTASVSATTGDSVADIEAALLHEPKIKLGQFSNVLVVDDVFNVGKTAAAMILHLRKHGLSRSAKITVAVALYVPRRGN